MMRNVSMKHLCTSVGCFFLLVAEASAVNAAAESGVLHGLFCDLTDGSKPYRKTDCVYRVYWSEKYSNLQLQERKKGSRENIWLCHQGWPIDDWPAGWRRSATGGTDYKVERDNSKLVYRVEKQIYVIWEASPLARYMLVISSGHRRFWCSETSKRHQWVDRQKCFIFIGKMTLDSFTSCFHKYLMHFYRRICGSSSFVLRERRF